MVIKRGWLRCYGEFGGVVEASLLALFQRLLGVFSLIPPETSRRKNSVRTRLVVIACKQGAFWRARTLIYLKLES